MQCELSESEIQRIIKALIHSANVHRHFCVEGSSDYPIEETNKLIEESNVIADKLRKMI